LKIEIAFDMDLVMGIIRFLNVYLLMQIYFMNIIEKHTTFEHLQIVIERSYQVVKYFFEMSSMKMEVLNIYLKKNISII
jgi:hypothetical protein